MPPLDPATDFEDDGGIRGYRVNQATWRCCSAGRVIASLIFLPPMALAMGVAAWLLWLASAGSVLALAGIAALALAVSRRTGRTLAGSLILIAWSGAALFVVGACGLVVWAFARQMF